MGYTLPRDFLSASQINMYLTCAKQYEYRYIHNLVIPPGIEAIKGTSIHNSLEFLFKSKMEKKDINEKELMDKLIFYHDENTKKYDYKYEGNEKDKDIKILLAVGKKYYDTMFHNIIPIATEYELTGHIDGVPMKGYIDLIRENDKTTEGFIQNKSVVVDYKTSTKKWSQNKLDKNMQFNIYSIMLNTPNIEVQNILLTQKAPIHTLRTVLNNENNKKHIKSCIKDVAASISKGNFPRCSPESWCCNNTWCGYYDKCRGGK